MTTNKDLEFESKIGKPVGLTCSAKGNPKPKITWKRRDNKRFRLIDKTTNSFRLGNSTITFNKGESTYYLFIIYENLSTRRRLNMFLF